MEEKLACAAVPVPLKPTTCVGPANPLLLTTMVSVPLIVPGAAGPKVTVIVQLAPAFTPAPQLSVSAKLEVVEMATVIGTLPVLLRVTGCPALVVPGFWLLKVRLAVETCVEIVTPVPVRLTVCAVAEAEVVTDNAPARVPVAVGEKVKLKTQPAPTAKDVGQLLVWAKSGSAKPLLHKTGISANTEIAGARIARLSPGRRNLPS